MAQTVHEFHIAVQGRAIERCALERDGDASSVASSDDSQEVDPQHPDLWGCGWTQGWVNGSAHLPSDVPAKQLTHGYHREFYDRLLKWWRELIWPCSDESPDARAENVGFVSFIELAVHFELVTQTRLPVCTSHEKGTWALVDRVPTAALISQSLKDKGMLLNNATKILQKHCAGFVIPQRSYDHALRKYGCKSRFEVHGLSCRPRLMCNSLAEQLVSHFANDDVRRARLPLDVPFVTSFSGVPLVRVLPQEDDKSLASVLAWGFGQVSSADLKRVELQAKQETKDQISCNKKTVLSSQASPLVVENHRITFLDPAGLKTNGALEKTFLATRSVEDQKRAYSDFLFWSNDYWRSCFAAANKKHVLGLDRATNYFKCYLCTCSTAPLTRHVAGKRACKGWASCDSSVYGQAIGSLGASVGPHVCDNAKARDSVVVLGGNGKDAGKPCSGSHVPTELSEQLGSGVNPSGSRMGGKRLFTKTSPAEVYSVEGQGFRSSSGRSGQGFNVCDFCLSSASGSSSSSSTDVVRYVGRVCRDPACSRFSFPLPSAASSSHL